MTITTAFFGTPDAALPTLRKLHVDTDLRLVVSRPDRPRGRGRVASASPVSTWALERGLPLARPSSRAELVDLDLTTFDVAVVVAYGAIIPPGLLAGPRRGFLNVHFSLLPRWRGAAPVAHSILAGDDMVGVSIMVLDEGLDTGPVLAVAKVVPGSRTAGDLTDELAAVGADLLLDVLADHVDGRLTPTPQDDALATVAPKLGAGDGRLDPREGADALVRRIRALSPRPGAWFTTEDGRLKVLAAATTDDPAPAPGDLVVGTDGDPVLGTSRGGLVLLMVQPESRGAMTGAAWARGRRDGLGRVL